MGPAELERLELLARIATLEARIAELEARGGEAVGEAQDVPEEKQRAEGSEGAQRLQGEGRVSTRKAVK